MEDIFNGRRIRLREFINSLNIKDKRFAERIGKSPAVLSQLLNGYRKISAEIAFDIAKQYDWFNPEWLISGSGMMRRDENSIRSNPIDEVEPIITEPKMEHVERLREAVLNQYKPDPPLTVKQDLVFRQACYRVLADNPGQPWPSLIVGGVAYLRIILSNPNVVIPPDRERIGTP